VNIRKKIEDTIKDITSVDVVTYTGTISYETDGGKFDWTKLLGTMKAGGSADVQVVAATHVSVDFDILNFRASGFSEGEMAELVTLHSESLRRSLEARLAFIDMFGKMIPSGS